MVGVKCWWGAFWEGEVARPDGTRGRWGREAGPRRSVGRRAGMSRGTGGVPGSEGLRDQWGRSGIKLLIDDLVGFVRRG